MNSTLLPPLPPKPVSLNIKELNTLDELKKAHDLLN
jgi:hypothetical protein